MERLISILAGLAVTGGLAWGLYLQGRIDGVSAETAAHSTQLEVDKTHFEYIKVALDRIEAKLQKEGK